MNRLLPKGADLLADIRRQGLRPGGFVLVLLDTDRPRPKIYSDWLPTIEVCIKPTAEVDGVDLWPLVDLDVVVHGGAALSDRLRAFLKLIVRQRPRLVIGAVPADRLFFCWRPEGGWEFDHVG